MEPIPVPEAARLGRPDCQFVRMGPPPGVKGEDCGTAEMLISPPGRIPGYSGRANYAYYKPTPEQLEQLRDGGFIELAQFGSVVQPFSLTVWPAWDGEAAAAAARRPPTEGGTDDDTTDQGRPGGETAADDDRAGADSREVGAVVSEVLPAAEEGGAGEPSAGAPPQPCAVCSSTSRDDVCVTASGRHWFSLTPDQSPPPPEIVAALTAPQHRTEQQQALIDRGSRP